MLSDLVKIGIYICIFAVVCFVIWAVLQRVPADKDMTDINWASNARRQIRLQDRVSRRKVEIVNLPSESLGGGTLAADKTASVARAVSPPLLRPVKRVRKTGYWREVGGQIVPTAKAALIEQWAIAAL